MFFNRKKLQCSSCKKELQSDEKVALFVHAGELNGMTNLKAFAKLQRLECLECVAVERK
ncbi:hypothetical protein NSQ54_04070 [Alkalihalobacillus sp. FSL W8-0930]